MMHDTAAHMEEHTVSLLSPLNGETISLHTEVQKKFRQTVGCSAQLAAHDWLALRRQGEDHTVPLSVTFTWACDTGISLFELSTDESFSPDSITARFQTSSKTAELTNLLVHTRYFWRVNSSAPSSFTTEDIFPRWLTVPGISNVRDFGNLRTPNGRTKQGLLYRGTEMDIHHTITPAGKWIMTEEMKLRTDLDFRRESIGSPLGNKVNHCQVFVRAYRAFIEDKETCKALFGVLSDAENYPIYLHCWGGADRTGCAMFILGAVLGVSEEDLIYDFELTSLSVWGERRQSSALFAEFEEALSAYGDAMDSVNTKALRFVRDCGVSDAEIEAIRSILTEREA